ncbi:BTB/POZ domain-containing protein 6-B [Bacillus rossius redtenbacheri]|uniref:BTB/POZ domain-containing protein 6-B n=1 Tax=Bacillus rossius redtenbacheri TaxID=93214 RepID=UPI002FDEBB4F
MECCKCDWQVYKQRVSERGEYLLETGQWSDCKFAVGTEPHQKVFEAHKLFLAMSSPVFEAMFYGGMAEKNEPIPILDVQPEAFKALLEYIYTDVINLQSFDQACELCYVAKKYMLPHLVKECTKYIWRDLHAKNACRAYQFAKLFEEPTLMDKCIEIISSETERVLGDPGFEEVELSTLVTILEQESLCVSSELVLFDAVERWARKECARKGLSPDDNKSLRAVAGPALQKLRFLTLKPAQFAEGPALSPLLLQEESFAVLVNISAPGGGKLPLPEGFCPSAKPRQGPAKSVFDLPVTMDTIKDGNKFVCLRQVAHKPPIPNNSILDCTMTFTVDKNICILGVQVPTQVHPNSAEVPAPHDLATLRQPPSNESYTELLYAHLLDCDGSRLTYTHFTSRVFYGQLVEIGFNRPVYIQRNKVYRVGVVLNKMGWYPMGVCSQSMTCDSVIFNFCVGQPSDYSRDGLIRSIVFTY